MTTILSIPDSDFRRSINTMDLPGAKSLGSPPILLLSLYSCAQLPIRDIKLFCCARKMPIKSLYCWKWANVVCHIFTWIDCIFTRQEVYTNCSFSSFFLFLLSHRAKRSYSMTFCSSSVLKTSQFNSHKVTECHQTAGFAYVFLYVTSHCSSVYSHI